MSKDRKIKTFLSHADLDKAKAGMLRDKLSSYRIEVFVAHDDLEGGEQWRKMLISQIKECDVFLILLTPNFHLANFTEQEAGVAIALEKPIVPISLDGQKSYGFVTDFQDTKITEKMENKDIQKLAQNIYRRACKTAKESLDLLVQSLEFAASYSEAVKLSNVLLIYRDELNQEQVRNLARAYLKNDQIHGSFAGGWIGNLLVLKESLLGLELKNKIQRYVQTFTAQIDEENQQYIDEGD